MCNDRDIKTRIVICIMSIIHCISYQQHTIIIHDVNPLNNSMFVSNKSDAYVRCPAKKNGNMWFGLVVKDRPLLGMTSLNFPKTPGQPGCHEFALETLSFYDRELP